LQLKSSCGHRNDRIPKRPTQKLFSSIPLTCNSVGGIGVVFENSRDDQAVFPHHSQSDERNWWLRGRMDYQPTIFLDRDGKSGIPPAFIGL
jgi:hypothetical protein